MSSRSDVGIVLHPDVEPLGFHKNLTTAAKALLGQPEAEYDGYKFYCLKGIAWGAGDSYFQDAKELQAALRALPGDKYRVLDVDPEYPNSDVGDMGELMDEPFNMRRVVTALLERDLTDQETKELIGGEA